MSIESQQRELERNFSGQQAISIVQTFIEAKSAKEPGRPLFEEMIRRLERGEADGIVAWAPDRLARNSIDGGRIVYLLDRGILQDLKFATYTFENNSQGKFMLSIMFGQSKYYSDALSENVRRGNRTKLENGWRPNKAPLGYLNNADKTITPDPMRFPLIRRMFELALTGCAPKQIAIIARDEWGFRTPVRRRSGGTAVALSTVYKILANPFYAGVILWDGRAYPGRHEQAVTASEFERVQALLHRQDRPRPQKHDFPLVGLIRCQSCGLMVTAEQKINRYGSRYVYYHCTKRGLGPRCPEPAVRDADLEDQILAFLRSIRPHPLVERSLHGLLASAQRMEKGVEDAKRRSLESALADVEVQKAELTRLRLRQLIADDEFCSERNRLDMEAVRLAEATAKLPKTGSRFELFSDGISFSKLAVNGFQRGDSRIKRLIVKTVGSNLFLNGKILSLQAAKPFLAPPFSASFLRLCGDGEDVRTFPKEAQKEFAQFCERLDSVEPLEHDLLRLAIRELEAMSPSDERDAA